jgi:hypothetical protein
MNALIEWPLIIMHPISIRKNIEKKSLFLGVYCGAHSQMQVISYNQCWSNIDF